MEMVVNYNNNLKTICLKKVYADVQDSTCLERPLCQEFAQPYIAESQ